MSELPNTNNNFRATLDYELSLANLNAIFGGMWDALQPYRDVVVQADNAINALNARTLQVIGDSITPELDALRASIGEAQGAVDALIGNNFSEDLAGKLAKEQNLEDLPDKGAARTALELKAVATKDFATQAEAEAGEDNTKPMTPLRTAQAISKLVPDVQGATETEDGAKGAVPAPTSADVARFLRGDGQWADIPIQAPTSWGALASFTTPGVHTFTVPDGQYYLKVKMWSGGGGGGSGAHIPPADHLSAQGGTGGSFASKIVQVSPGDQFSVVVGAGGGGGAEVDEDVSGNDGGNGGTTSFGSVFSVEGGGGGYAATTANQNRNQVQNTRTGVAIGVPDYFFRGGYGDAGEQEYGSISSVRYANGGGGGGGAGDAASGGDAYGNISGSGGANLGGNGGEGDRQSDGDPGSDFGGGGGGTGSYNSSSGHISMGHDGGSGAPGAVIIEIGA